ncbi:flavin reductase family protein [Brevundimonas diminuta]|uniref:flavin reductase family protein n=1 Tax=Brevundimonas diminuta TaxID=293 RepID=UPI003CFC7374
MSSAAHISAAMPILNDISEEIDLRRLFGSFPTGVTALCAVDRNGPVGMTVSAFTAVSLRPPLVSVCVRHGSRTWRQLRTRERIGISFLGHGHAAAARRLARNADDRFEGLECQPISGGALFLTDATAWLECSIEKEIEAGDHDIVLFRLHRAAVADGSMPLVFHSGGFHTITPVTRMS